VTHYNYGCLCRHRFCTGHWLCL